MKALLKDSGGWKSGSKYRVLSFIKFATDFRSFSLDVVSTDAVAISIR
jgi:hypothetical protein